MHALILQEWWLKNMKLNYSSGFKKNFFTYSTIQNYAGGAGKAMVTLADRSELNDLSLPPSTQLYVKRVPYQAMELVSNITKNDLEYLPSNYTVPVGSLNLAPTSFIGYEGENVYVYVYYSNVVGGKQKYVLNTDNLKDFFTGVDYVIPGVATIYNLIGTQPYSTEGESTLFDINECYDGSFGSAASHPWEMKELSTPHLNVPNCGSGVESNKCLVADAYSIGYFKIPITPHYFRMGEGIITTNTELTNLKIFPNPANEYFTITFDRNKLIDNVEISIYNLEGELLLTKNVINSNFVDVSNLASGFYIICCNDRPIDKLVISR